MVHYLLNHGHMVSPCSAHSGFMMVTGAAPHIPSRQETETPYFLPLCTPSGDASALGPPRAPTHVGITMNVPNTEGRSLNLIPNNAQADRLLSLPLSFCLGSSQAHGTLRISCRLWVPPSPACRAAPQKPPPAGLGFFAQKFSC